MKGFLRYFSEIGGPAVYCMSSGRNTDIPERIEEYPTGDRDGAQFPETKKPGVEPINLELAKKTEKIMKGFSAFLETIDINKL